jgi:hypothetical protein
VPLSQYMERIYADELATHKSADAAAMATAAQVTMTGSSSSYLGEASRRTSSPMATPLAAARKQHLMRLGLQAAIAVLLVVLGGGVVFWQTRRNDVPRGAAAPPAVAAVPAAQPAAAAPGAAGVAKGTAPAGVPVAAAAPAVGAPVAAAPLPGVPAHARPAAKPGDAHITVASEPRCELLVDGVPYGATPLIDLAVPAGKHTIVLLNSAANVRETKKVALREGELWTRSFSFEGGKATEQNGLSAKMLAGHAESAAVVPAPKAETTPVVAAAVPHAAAPAASPTPKPTAPAPAAAAPAPATAPKPIEGAASGAKPAAVASMVPPKPRNVAARMLDSQQISHADPHLPEIVRIQRKGTGDARFAAKVCLGNDGRVYQVNVLSSIPGADDAIVSTIKQWTYKPQPVSVCFVANIVYDLQ